MKKDIFIGGAWPYANYYLHVGHLASLLPGDIIARFYRKNNNRVIYVSGSDCHGTPITQRAKKEGVKAEDIAKHYHEEFKKTFKNMEFSYDLYTSTTDSYHEKQVQEYFLKLKENGYIYELEDEEDYCPKCHTFLADREIIGTCPHCGKEATGDQCEVCLTALNSNEVLDKHCKNCGSKTIMKNNKHLYFKLTAFQNDLQELINKNKNRWRKNALGEAQKYIDMGLIDRATTRQLEWGVEVPVKGYEDKRIYVWIEAVLGYLTAGKKVCEEKNIDFDKFMNDDNNNLLTYYIHGKDNIPFHTTIYPALLKGLKLNYRLPDYIISSAYVNLNDEKMSKSKGNLITVNELLETFEADTLRFYFTFNAPEVKDTNCSVEEIINQHNKFLVGALGNFINRNVSFIVKKFDGVIKEAKLDKNIKDITITKYQELEKLIENGELKQAITAIFEYISLGNKYYDEKEPWILAKENREEFNNVTYTCLYMIENIANFIDAFMPNTASKINKMFSLSKSDFKEIVPTGDIKLEEIPLLFNRIDR